MTRAVTCSGCRIDQIRRVAWHYPFQPVPMTHGGMPNAPKKSGLRLCRALWTGEPVDWDGRWQVRSASFAPPTWAPSGPLIWVSGTERPSGLRAGRWFDGWMPISPSPSEWTKQWTDVETAAKRAGRDPAALCGAMYLTLSVDEDIERADNRLNEFLQHYYNQPGSRIRSWQACYAGSASGVAELFVDHAKAGVTHFVLRFVGEHERHLEAVATVRATLGW
jgi:alkanesulfonate monooxygenase SsuD/methylene tetrahydromethanopterin reductase-like flavin-dependent oxidoreductase (luciferase family)